MNVEEETFYYPEYPSNGGTHPHCIDIMLQHAVMHPIRHDFQLRELLERQSCQRLTLPEFDSTDETN